jgi:DNA-3-methyladenine glycosylase
MLLKRDFFDRPTLDVAKDLLGKTLVFGQQRAIINETEAYIGENDPACHAAKGRTKRTDVMFGPAGYSYVYLIYGMYHCLNVVTERKGFPAAVLIRGAGCFDGPGKLCRGFGITLQDNRIDLTKNRAFYLLDTPSIMDYECTRRIGISKGKEHLWRFVSKEQS